VGRHPQAHGAVPADPGGDAPARDHDGEGPRPEGLGQAQKTAPPRGPGPIALGRPPGLPPGPGGASSPPCPSGRRSCGTRPRPPSGPGRPQTVSVGKATRPPFFRTSAAWASSFWYTSVMPVYQYKARDRQGRLVEATIEAEDLRTAARLLRDRGLFVAEIKEPGRGPSGRGAPARPGAGAGAQGPGHLLPPAGHHDRGRPHPPPVPGHPGKADREQEVPGDHQGGAHRHRGRYGLLRRPGQAQALLPALREPGAGRGDLGRSGRDPGPSGHLPGEGAGAQGQDP
jgi:hypothetical protein